MTGKLAPTSESRIEADVALHSRTFSAVLWSLVTHWLTRLISPLVFLILARVLTPEDYGVAAVATMVIAFCQVVAEAGMGKVLVHRQRDGEDILDVANNAFWTNFAMSVFLFLLILLAAPSIAELFAEPRSTNVIRIQALQMLCGVFSIVPMALLQRNLDYKTIFSLQLVSSTVPGLLSVPLAIYGMGYWALVLGSLAGSFGSALWLWRISDWHPCLRLHRQSLTEMLRYGLLAMGEGISGWMFLWLDAILVGIYLSSKELGLYRTAGSLVAVLAGLIVAPVVPVIFRVFSLIQSDRQQLRGAYLKATRLMTMVSVLTSIALLAGFEYWPALVFGSQWQGIEPVLYIFLMLYAYGGLSYANAELFRAANRADIPVLMNGIVMVVYFVGYSISLRVGFETFLFARYLLAVFSLLAHIVALDLIMGVSVAAYLRQVVPSLAIFAAFVLLMGLLGDLGVLWTPALGMSAAVLLVVLHRRECGAALSGIWKAGFDSSARG